MSALDRDAARKVLADQYDMTQYDEETLDRLEACVRPAPPQSIDRNQVWRIWADWVLDQKSGHADQFVNEVLALLRPVDGVVLTRKEAALAAEALRQGPASRDAASGPREWYGRALDLAARLEAAS